MSLVIQTILNSNLAILSKALSNVTNLIFSTIFQICFIGNSSPFPTNFSLIDLDMKNFQAMFPHSKQCCLFFFFLILLKAEDSITYCNLSPLSFTFFRGSSIHLSGRTSASCLIIRICEELFQNF